MCGPADDAIVQVLGEHGAGRVYVVDDPAVGDFLVAPKAEALAQVVGRTTPAEGSHVSCPAPPSPPRDERAP